MNTTVITAAPVDLGAGQHERVTFVGCKWHVDNTGTLHIINGPGGNTAAFATGAWLAVTDGNKVVAAEVKR